MPLKAQERRISTLNEHLAQVEIYGKHKAVYAKYKQLDPKKRGTYAGKHAEEIAEHESARKYLKEHLNGYGKIPDKSWRAERDQLLAERQTNVEEYYKIREDVKSVEVLRQSAENLMRDSIKS